MNFSYSEEQQLLADSLARFLEREYGFEQRKAIVRSAAGWSKGAWKQLADIGVLGLLIPADHGGFGGTPADLAVVMQAFGRGLVVEPFLATSVLGAGFVAAAGCAAEQTELLPAIASGEAILAFAGLEPGARFDLAHVETSAKRDGAAFVLNGRKAVVLHGGQADRLVVSARTAGAARDEKGVSLFLVDAKAKGVSVRDYRTIDGLRAADVSFDKVSVPADRLLGALDEARPVIDRVLDLARAALCAEAIGVMETLNAQTLDYLKTRQQFGQPIGRFQALQHRAVDMFTAAEQSKSMSFLASMRAASADPKERRAGIRAACMYVARAGRRIAQEAIQLHGGMGVTDDLAASHYAKRLTMLGFWMGVEG